MTSQQPKIFHIWICLLILSTSISCKNESNRNKSSSEISSISAVLSSQSTDSVSFIGQPITEQTIQLLTPILQDWLQYYKLDIKNFSNDKDWGNAFFTPAKFDIQKMNTIADYNPKDDPYNPAIYFYSPDKQKYIDIWFSIGIEKRKNGKYYYIHGGDDSQSTFITDKKARRASFLTNFGTRGLVESVYWLNNKDFVMVGTEHDSDKTIFFIILTGKDGGFYSYSEKGQKSGYFEESMRLKGIIIDN